MINPDFLELFFNYLDPKTEFDDKGKKRAWKDQSLVPDAPQSAIDAFEEYKVIITDAEKKGIKL